MYARPDVQELLEPLVVSWGWQSDTPGVSRFIDHHEWQGTRDLSAFLAVPAAIEFQREHDWDQVQAACHALATEAERRICELTGLPSLYSDHTWFAQMAAALLPAGTDMIALKEFLYDQHHIEVPLIRWNGRILMRVSVQGYNSTGDIDVLVKALTDWGTG